MSLWILLCRELVAQGNARNLVAYSVNWSNADFALASP